MGRALRVAQLAAAAARCAPSSSTLGSPRVWQLAGHQRAPTLRLAAQMKPGAGARHNHTAATTSEPAAEKPVATEEAVLEKKAASEMIVLEETPLWAEESVSEDSHDDVIREGDELMLEEPASEDSREYMERVAAMIERMEALEARLGEAVRRRKPRATESKTSAGTVEWASASLNVRPAGGKLLKLDPLWVRDSCPCDKCVDPHSGQKTFATTDLADNPKVYHAKFLDNGDLRVVFGNDRPSQRNEHESIFPKSEVAQWQAEPHYWRGRAATKRPWTIPWDNWKYIKMTKHDGRCSISYKDWMENDAAFWDVFGDLCQTGLIFVRDVPEDEESVRRIAERIGQLQHTFYGWTWDVKSKPQAENVAYTSSFLGLHQDLMYHEPIPQLQLLHCLSNSCAGGESLFSNGLRAAYELEYLHPEHYNALCTYKPSFGYNKNGNHYWASRRTIKTTPDGAPLETRWAPPFQTPAKMTVDPKAQESFRRWKKAAFAFQKIVEAKRNMYEVKMEPGDCVIFNNSTVLHGRRQFQTAEGSRWLKGAYISPQTFLGAISRLEAVRQSQGNPLPSIFRGHDDERAYVRNHITERLEYIRRFQESRKEGP